MSSNGGGTNTNTSHGSGGSGGGGNGNGGIYLKVDGSTPLTGIWTTGNYGINLGSGTLVAADLTATSLVALNSDLTLSAGLVNRSINITPSGTGTVKVAAGKTLKVDTINESTTNATTVTLANTGTSTDAAAVAISSTTGGVTITAAANKNVTIATSGTGLLTINSVAVPTVSSADTLTNKVMSGALNTFSNISDAALSTSYLKADGTRQVSGPTWDMGAPDLTTTGIIKSSQFQGNTGQHTYVQAELNKNVYLTTSGTGAVVVYTGQTLKVDTINESTTNATTVTIANTGTSTDAAAFAISSTSGGVTITAAANKNVAIATSGTGRLTNNSVAVPTISSTDSLTNKTLNSTTNTIRPSASFLRYYTSVAQSLANGTTTPIAFATLGESLGSIGSEVTLAASGSGTKFTNTSGAARVWLVGGVCYTTSGSTTLLIVDMYNGSAVLQRRYIAVCSSSGEGSLTTPVYVSNNYYILVSIFQNSGGVQTLNYASPHYVTTITLTDLGFP